MFEVWKFKDIFTSVSAPVQKYLRVQNNLLSTGIESLDRLMDGIADNSTLEIYGWEGVGKTSLCLQLLNAVPSTVVLYWDLDHTFDTAYAAKMVTDYERVVLVQGKQIDAFRKIYNQLYHDIGRDQIVVVIDSIANILQIIDEHNIEQVEKLLIYIRKHCKLLIWTNQYREYRVGRIKVRELYYHKLTQELADQRIGLHIERELEGDEIEDKDNIIGMRITVDVIKNLYGMLRSGNVKFIFNKGFV